MSVEVSCCFILMRFYLGPCAVINSSNLMHNFEMRKERCSDSQY